jgi:hypothetical protein
VQRRTQDSHPPVGGDQGREQDSPSKSCHLEKGPLTSSIACRRSMRL